MPNSTTQKPREFFVAKYKGFGNQYYAMLKPFENREKLASKEYHLIELTPSVKHAVEYYNELVDLNEQLIAINRELNKDDESDRIESNIRRKIEALLQKYKEVKK